ncbi:unnamed protein product [Allacma fusca]|uniref:Major facilitator superfamily (MFS) profile domain-containing protein n=1 Tax=Allacma fusca TaxID=39272 RepID=A0A8J2LLN6_9HEXA|nr:unnamed protein product [Allacma fusca]
MSEDNKHADKGGDLAEMVDNSEMKKPKGWGSRHSLALLGFFGFTLLHGMRVNMSLAIVAMVSHNDGVILKSTDTFPTESFVNGTSTLLLDDKSNGSLLAGSIWNHDNDSQSTEVLSQSTKFDWNEKSQGLVLGSIYWGSLVAKIPGGLFAQRYGGKFCLGIGIFGASVMSLLIPVAAMWNWHALLITRAVQGLFDGFCSPAMHTILAKWAPPSERSKLGTFIYAGGQLGTAIVMVSSGYMIESNFVGGWPAPFYVTGALGATWTIFWLVLASESPDKSSRTSVEEMIFIQKSIGTQPRKAKLAVPWKQVLTSMPVWAIIVANTADAWGFYTFLTELPTYMKTVLHFNIKTNSWLSALPYLISWGFSNMLTQVADHLISSKRFTIVTVRKACETIGHLGSAITLVAASYAGVSKSLTVSLLIIGIAINGATYGGYGVNHVDIAPNHAGVLLGVTSTIANVCGIAAPYVASVFINEQPTLDNWQSVFFITAGIYIFDVIFYLTFASGEVQHWNEPAAP